MKFVIPSTWVEKITFNLPCAFPHLTIQNMPLYCSLATKTAKTIQFSIKKNRMQANAKKKPEAAAMVEAVEE